MGWCLSYSSAVVTDTMGKSNLGGQHSLHATTPRHTPPLSHVKVGTEEARGSTAYWLAPLA